MIYTVFKSLISRYRPRLVKITYKNIFQIILTTLITTLLVFFVYFILTQITNTFVRLRLHDVYLTFVIFIILIISIIVGIVSIIKHLYFNKDNEIYIKLPIKKSQLFIGKLLYVSLQPIFTTFILVLISVGIYGFVMPNTSYVYFIKMFSLVLIIPLVTFPISIILSIPIAYITKRISKNWWSLLISLLIIISATFTLYISFVNIITNFIELTSSGTGSYIPEDIIFSIKNSAMKLPLAPYFYNYLLEGKYLGLIITIVVGLLLFIGSFFLLKHYYYKILNLQYEGNGTIKINENNLNFTKKKPYQAIFIREVKTLAKNPSYAFSAIIFNMLMPLFVVLTINLTDSVGATAVGKGIIPSIVILTTLMFIMIANSYQTTLISRDKNAFYLTRIIPVNYFKQILTRLSVGLIFSLLAILITYILLVSLGLLNFITALQLLVISILFLIAFNANAVYYDFKNPNVEFDSTQVSDSVKVLNVFIFGIMVTLLISFRYLINHFFSADLLVKELPILSILSARYPFYNFIFNIPLLTLADILAITSILLYTSISIIKLIRAVNKK